MKILYFTNVQFSKDLQPGVQKKILAQVNLMRNTNHTVNIACPYDDDRFVIMDKDCVVDYISIKDLYGPQKDKKIAGYLRNKGVAYNAIYIRNGSFSLINAKLYEYLHEKGVKVLMEIPTYPLSQRWTNIGQSIKQLKFKTTAKEIYNATIGELGIYRFSKGVDRIVTVNGFDKIWGIQTIKIGNGIDVEKQTRHQISHHTDRKVRLIAVANVARWHGYDRVIKGMKNYYSSGGDREVIFDIVGPGSEITELKKQVNELGLKNYVVFYGKKTGFELDELFNNADIAVSVLGVHRNKMKYYDSLKSREYAARAIPFITESAEQMYADLPFVLSVSNSEEPIDIRKVLDFFDMLCIQKDVEKSMFDFAKEQCDWRVTFSPVLNYFNSI